jgi:beta-lactamase regulating signal transducer with metallopeptidase domain
MMSALLNHLWQSTLVVAVVGLWVYFLRNHRAELRYWLWFAGAAKFLVPFALLVTLGTHLASQVPMSTKRVAPLLARVVAPAPPELDLTPLAATLPMPAAATPPHPSASREEQLARVLVGLWVCGAAVVLGRWTLRWSRLRQTVHDSVPVAVEAPIPVRSAATAIEPGVVGVVRPILLLPHAIEEHLNAEELRAVILHELEHVRRHDNLTACISMLTQSLFWFYPLTWWLGRRLIVERESACDQAVIAAGCDRETYAQGILNVCKLYVESPLACAAGVAGADLRRRIEFIMTHRPRLTLSAGVSALLAVSGVITVLVPVALGAAQTATPTAQVQTEGAADAQSQLKAAVALSRTLLKEARYSELDQRMNALQEQYRAGTLDELELLRQFNAFMLADPALAPQFDAWLSAFPNSYAARLARGIYNFKCGVQTRGTRFLAHTTEEQIRGMRLYLEKSRQDVQASVALDAKPMLSYNFLIRIAMELSDRTEKRQVLDTALRLDPVALLARRPYMISLETRWGGSLNEMLDFFQQSQAAGLPDAKLANLQALIDAEREWLQHHQGNTEQTPADSG